MGLPRLLESLQSPRHKGRLGRESAPLKPKKRLEWATSQGGMMDKVFNFDGLKVFVDATSLMYLNGCTVDYVETLEAAGFKFENPQVKSTCGCGSSFSA